jgi:sec-independent protein translocase protein TatA
MPGLQEWLVIVVIALFVFGPDRLPEAGRTLGNGVRRLRESVNGSHELRELRDEVQRLRQDFSGTPSPQPPAKRLPPPASDTDLDAT